MVSENKIMRPTAKMQWLRISANDLGMHHPSAISQGSSRFFLVLQQWWEQIPEFECDADDWKLHGEWRDIPIEG
jgi:hypothetical protein